ncbi:MAG: zinc-binding dehydrogenase [Promethearchaeota archaeon]
MKMRAAVFRDIKDVRLEEIDVPTTQADEVLVKIRAALTCGTDAKTYLRGLKKKTPYSQAIHIFGHEYAGDIVKIGSEVSGFSEGMRVVSANSAPCNKCFYCKHKQFSLCENITWLWGTFTEYINVPGPIVQQNLFEIPEHVDYKEAALVEPLACVLHGVERSDINIGDTVVINGSGPIGLMWTVLCKKKGARVIVTDLNEERLKVAKSLGAWETINAGETNDIIQSVRDLTEERRGVDVAIEAVGNPKVWENTILMGRKGATINLFGGCPSGTSINVDTALIHYSELKILGVFHHTPYFIRRALDLLSRGEIPTKQLITHELPLSEVDKALQMITTQQGIKIALIP